MTTKHLVDPELAPMLDMFPVFNFTNETLPHTRDLVNQMFEQMGAAAPAFPDIEVTERHIPGPQGAPDVRVLVYIPKNVVRPMPGMLWIHGGGYIIGTPEGEDLQAKQIVGEVGCAVVSVDYRLAPETPDPGPVEDCYAALKWLYTNTSDLGVDANRLAIGGGSAGGGLTAGLGLLTRDRGEVPLAFQLLIYPMLDDRTAVTPDPHPYTGEFVWTNEANHFGWSALLGQEPGSVGVSPYAAAARAESLAGLPPTYITVGALDLFLEEDLEYARQLIRAGVPTELHVYPAAFHGFNLMAEAKVSQVFRRDMLTALRRALQPK